MIAFLKCKTLCLQLINIKILKSTYAVYGKNCHEKNYARL